MSELSSALGFDHRFQCRITRDLAGELASSNGTAPDELTFATDRTRFGGVILQSGGRGVAAMGFSHEPDRTLAITDPLFLQPTPTGIRQQWTGWLLRIVFQYAEKNGSRLLRSLQPVETATSESWMTQTLASSGFTKRAGVAVLEKWTSAVPVPVTLDHQESAGGSARTGEPDPSTVMDVLAATQWPGNAATEGALKAVLRAILTESMDLPHLPVPDVDEMLTGWRRQQAEIVLVRQHGKAVGVCVVSVDSEPIPAAQVSPAAIILYIGVIPEVRRTGIASHLVALLPGLLSGAQQPQSRAITGLKTYCDAGNQPARRLYARCGFNVSGELDVWCRATEP